MRTVFLLLLIAILAAPPPLSAQDEYQYYRHYDFSGGGNWSTSAFTMPPNECPDIRNMIVTEDGALEKRNGYSLHSYVHTSQETEVIPHSIFRFYPTSGDAQWLMHGGTSLYLYNEALGQWDTQETGLSTAHSNWSAFMGDAFMTNDVDGLLKWDGSAVTNMSDAYGAPRCRYIEAYNNRLFLSGSTENPLEIYYSDLLNASLWPSGGSTSLAGVKAGYWVIQSRDNGVITGLKGWRDYLAIFTPNTIHLLQGAYPSEVSIQQLSGNIGCTAPRSITAARQEVFFKFNNHIYAIGDPPVPVSLKLGTQLSAGTNCVGLTYKRYFMMADPGDDNEMASTDKVWLFDMDRSIWTCYDDIPVSCAYTANGAGDNSVLLIGDSERARIYKWDEISYSDALGRNDRSYSTYSGQYPCWYLTKQFEMGTPEHYKKFRSIQADTYSSTGTFDLSYFIDYDRIDNSFSFTLDGSNSLDYFILDESKLSSQSTAIKVHPFRTGDGGKFIQVRFYNEQAEQQIKFYGFSIRWKPKHFRGGI